MKIKNYIVRKKQALLITILISVPFLLGAFFSVNPATNEEELVLIPAVKERKMGRNFDEAVKKHFTLPVDPLVESRVRELGGKLAKHADRKELVYRFTVINDKRENNYNAFAAPGGYIYIFDDLVELLDTDDNIAAVLAHEIGHIEAKHSVKRMQGSLAATLLLLASGQAQREQGTHAATNMAIGQLLSAYSRHDERQADELSVKYMRRAGFNTNGILGALGKLRKERKEAPRMAYFTFKSHPYLSERVAYLKTHINGYTDFESYINLVSDEEITEK